MILLLGCGGVKEYRKEGLVNFSVGWKVCSEVTGA